MFTLPPLILPRWAHAYACFLHHLEVLYLIARSTETMLVRFRLNIICALPLREYDETTYMSERTVDTQDRVKSTKLGREELEAGRWATDYKRKI